jgi:hypothetical protein
MVGDLHQKHHNADDGENDEQASRRNRPAGNLLADDD